MELRVRLSIVIRKTLHALLSIPLLLPFVLDVEKYVSIEVYYTMLTLIVCFIYLVYLKRHQLHLVYAEYLEHIRTTFTKLTSMLQQHAHIHAKLAHVQHIVSTFQKIELKIREMVELAERDYERRYSFVGMLMGCLGVLFSYILFSECALYGVLGLLVYDTLSALFGATIGRLKMPLSNVTVEGCLLAGLAYFTLVVLALHVDIVRALALTLSVIIAEAYGVEDNLSIPLLVSFVAYLLGLS